MRFLFVSVEVCGGRGGGHMIRRICGSLLILVVLLCVLSNPLAAQSCTGKLGIQRWDFGTLNPFPPGCFWLAASPSVFSPLLDGWGGGAHRQAWFPGWGGGGGGGRGGAGGRVGGGGG